MSEPAPRSPDHAPAQGAWNAVEHFSDHVLARQQRRVAELRAVSAALAAKLLDQVATSQRAVGEVSRSRQAIYLSRQRIKRTGDAAEASNKRIARSRALIQASALIVASAHAISGTRPDECTVTSPGEQPARCGQADVPEMAWT